MVCRGVMGAVVCVMSCLFKQVSVMSSLKFVND